MPLRSIIVGQFKHPRGWLGHMAGFVMASRASNRLRNAWTVDLIDIHPGHRVLEIGCGPGLALKACAEKIMGGRVVGLDHSALMVQQARRRLSTEIESGRAEVRLGNVADLSAETVSYDRVFSLNVVQFFPDRTKAYRDIFTILAPGGVVATTYQPRSAKPTRNEGVAMAQSIAETMTGTGFVGVRIKELPLAPVPAFCMIGDKP